MGIGGNDARQLDVVSDRIKHSLALREGAQADCANPKGETRQRRSSLRSAP